MFRGESMSTVLLMYSLRAGATAISPMARDAGAYLRASLRAVNLPARGTAMRQIVAAATLAASTMTAFAEGPGWTAASTVRTLIVTSSGGINVRLSPDLNNCVSQSGYGPNFASIYPGHPGINRIKADLLAAYLSRSPVLLYLSDSTCQVVETALGGG